MWDTVILVLVLLVGIGLAQGFQYLRKQAYIAGAQDRDTMYTQLSKAVGAIPPSPQDLYEATQGLKESYGYDLVFDSEVATYLASGRVARNWPNLLENVYQSAVDFAKDGPSEHNTIIVRSIKVGKQGEVKYEFQSLVNPSLSSEEG